MLPNHSPLVIAEQFGTLQALVWRPHRSRPGPRAGHRSAHRAGAAARLSRPAPTPFRRTCWNCRRLLGAVAAAPGRPAPCPAPGRKVPLWILGSSTFGAQLAARLGLPFAFASHFAPGMMMQALQVYRAQFPAVGTARHSLYAMVGVNVFAADTDVEAKRMATSLQQQFINCGAARRARCAPPVDTMDGPLVAGGARRRRAGAGLFGGRHARRRRAAAARRSSPRPAPTS